MNELRDGEGEETGCDVVEHDAGTRGQAFEVADWRGFEDVEEAEEDEGDCCVAPVGGDSNEGDELASDFVDDDVARVFTSGFAGHDGGGGDADQGGDDCGYCCADG